MAGKGITRRYTNIYINYDARQRIYSNLTIYQGKNETLKQEFENLNK